LIKLKKERAFYCSQIEKEKEEKKNVQGLTAYDFICKNTRKK
jgi:hypothetical protein